MKRQIRTNVFETNSSSQHSLCVMKKDEHYTSEEILKDFYLWDDRNTGEKDCEWHIWDHDMNFGRSPFRALGNFHDKWLYACASLVREYNDEKYKELESLALKYVPGLKRIVIPMISDSFADKDHPANKDSEYAQEYGKTEDELNEWLEQKERDWGIDTIEYWEGDNGYFHFDKPYTGCVDEDMLSGFLEEENVSLKEYLTNRKYVVIQKETLFKVLGVDISKTPDAYKIQVTKPVQRRKHKKKRINKKWLKKYGYKILVDFRDGWHIKSYADGHYEFVKGED